MRYEVRFKSAGSSRRLDHEREYLPQQVGSGDACDLVLRLVRRCDFDEVCSDDLELPDFEH
jgi:hypothetical protein